MDHIEKILRDSLQDAEYADGTPCEVIYKEDIPEIMRKINGTQNNQLDYTIIDLDISARLYMIMSEVIKKRGLSRDIKLSQFISSVSIEELEAYRGFGHRTCIEYKELIS